jgi:hypothetical protein
MRQPTRAVRDHTDELRTAITALLEELKPGEMKRLHAKATKIAANRPVRRPASGSKPKLSEWQPKDMAAARAALAMMQSGVGVRSAPFEVAPEAWRHKWFVSEVALRLRKSMQSGRAVTATTALLVSAMAARVVEAAAELKEANPSFASAEMRTQTYRDDSGWDKTRTRGSGVVFNDAGRRLFEVAAEAVAQRMEQGALAAHSSGVSDGSEGSDGSGVAGESGADAICSTPATPVLETPRD